MKLASSLQGRLGLALGAMLVLLWLATSLATATLLKAEMSEVFDSALEETAQRILPLAVMDIIGRDEAGLEQRIATLRDHEEFFTYVVRDAEGRVLLRSHGADDTVFPAFQAMGFDQTATHRLYYDAALQGSVTIAIAEPLSHRDEVARKVLIGLAMPLVLLVPLGLLAVIWIVGRSLRPVRHFGRDLASRGGGDLSAVAVAGLPDEIAPVAGAVNALLARLDRVLQAERSFTANAAHELRTPLAAALAQTQRLIAETGDPGAAQRGAEVEAALKRLTRLAEKLMQLARAEGGRLRRTGKTDLAPVLALVLHDLGRDASAQRLQSPSPHSAAPQGPVLSDIDPDAFAIAARNLIENALNHGAGPVTVTLDGAALRVVNAAPELSAETLARLSRRFERGQTAADGSGLGLSIVQAIAEGAGGKLTLSTAPGRFVATFGLPQD